MSGQGQGPGTRGLKKPSSALFLRLAGSAEDVLPTFGGDQVIKKWFSYREKPLLGRSLTVAEVRYCHRDRPPDRHASRPATAVG